MKDSFECGDFRLNGCDDLHNSAIDEMQSMRKRFRGSDSYNTTADVSPIGAIAIDDAITGHSGSAVDAEYSHESGSRAGQFVFLDIEIRINMLNVVVFFHHFH
jgi:hypothetical protein